MGARLLPAILVLGTAPQQVQCEEQRLLDLLSVIIARANADIIRNLPARGRYAPSSPSEPPSASSSPQYEVDDDDDDRKENYSPQWEASSPGYD